MRAIWKGSISFGLVNVPVSLFTATRQEELKFHLLRASDLSPINYRRVAELDGKEVPWEQIVKGYEYEKGKYVVLKDDDFKRVDVEATQTIDIVDFVDAAEINPIFFQKPYYLEPQKGGDRVYHLLREALQTSGRTGIAKVVIKTRQHLAAIKPNGELLALELMHFASEIVDPSDLRVPAAGKTARREQEMAQNLIDQMTVKWDPTRYTDDYRSALLELIERKVEQGGRAAPTTARAARGQGKVIDLMAALKQSLDEAAQTRRTKSRPASKTRSRRKAA